MAKSNKPKSENLVNCYLTQSRITKRWYYSTSLWKVSSCKKSDGTIESEGNATVQGSNVTLDPDAFTTRMLPESFRGASKASVVKKGKYFDKAMIDITTGDIHPRS